MIFLVDASAIIAFCSEKELNRPDLLDNFSQGGFELVIPYAVFEEIKNGPKTTVTIFLEKVNNGRIKLENVSKEETERLRKRYPRLHDGEVQVLLMALALEEVGLPYYCVFDDGLARKTAKKLKLKLTGTKGLLNRLKDMGILDEENREMLLNKLINSRFRLK